MSEADKSYELEILKMIVNKHLDESTLFNKENINESETKRDQFVWDTATKIYQQSGHKVELSLVRDIVDSRIRAIKNQLAEEARCIADAEEARRIADAEKAQQFLSKVTDALGKFGGDERKAKVFVRVRELISEQLGVEEREVSLDSHLSNHLGADECDLQQIVMVLEEEFEIEIPDGNLHLVLFALLPLHHSTTTITRARRRCLRRDPLHPLLLCLLPRFPRPLLLCSRRRSSSRRGVPRRVLPGQPVEGPRVPTVHLGWCIIVCGQPFDPILSTGWSV